MKNKRSDFHKKIFTELLNESDPIEYAASEYRSTEMYLDELNVPIKINDKTLSLVGRIKYLIGEIKK